jgi:hypothetical protein
MHPLGRSSRLGEGADEAYGYAMEQLAQPLSLLALVGGTLEYAILIRHRQERREVIRWQGELQDSLRSAGRALERPVPVRRWIDSTHFKLDR